MNLAALRRAVARLKAEIVPEPMVKVRPRIRIKHPDAPEFVTIPRSEASRPRLFIPRAGQPWPADGRAPLEPYLDEDNEEAPGPAA